MTKRFLGIGLAGLLAVLAACNGSAASGDCTTLPSCCDQLADPANKSECMRVVAMGDDVSCGDAQSTFEVDNLCTASSDSSDS
jgi:hypothetical protein